MPISEIDQERFWSQVNKDGPVLNAELGPCWLWRPAAEGPSSNARAYGTFTYRGRDYLAHRFAFEISNQLEPGDLPSYVVIAHHCDNPPCVRPTHTRAGSQADNVADMVAKGRAATGDRNGTHTQPNRRPRGERNGRSKLQASEVAEIKWLLTHAHLTHQQIADIFRGKVNRSQITRIASGQIWGHVRPKPPKSYAGV